MKTIFRTAVAASIALTLVSCGGSKSSPAPEPESQPTTTVNISGQAIKGTIKNGVVRIKDLTGKLLGFPVRTNDVGQYTLSVASTDLGIADGVLIVEVTGDEQTTMICDAPVCGDKTFGEEISNKQTKGLALKSITIPDGNGDAQANINVLTTMATDILRTSADNNENIDLSAVTKDELETLQQASSDVVGQILKIDLSQTNLYEIKVKDASEYTAETETDSLVDTLSAFNASFSGLPVADDKTVADTINEFTEAVKQVTELSSADEVDVDALTEVEYLLDDTLTKADSVRTDIVADLGQTVGEALTVVEVGEPGFDTTDLEPTEPTDPTGATGGIQED